MSLSTVVSEKIENILIASYLMEELIFFRDFFDSASVLHYS